MNESTQPDAANYNWISGIEPAQRIKKSWCF